MGGGRGGLVQFMGLENKTTLAGVWEVHKNMVRIPRDKVCTASQLCGSFALPVKVWLKPELLRLKCITSQECCKMIIDHC